VFALTIAARVRRTLVSTPSGDAAIAATGGTTSIPMNTIARMLENLDPCLCRSIMDEIASDAVVSSVAILGANAVSEKEGKEIFGITVVVSPQSVLGLLGR
jgi:hypothetical protein